jgi:hypothetical protein
VTLPNIYHPRDLKGFKRIDPQDFSKLVNELCFILNRRGLITGKLAELAQESGFGKVALSIVIGSFELLTALSIAKLLGIGVYARTGNGEPSIGDERLLLWNGFLTEGEFTVPFMSPEGAPDMELHEEGSCTLIEVTLGLAERTLLYELGEALRHKPTLECNVSRRILITPHHGRDLNEIVRFVENKFKGVVWVHSIYSIVEHLCRSGSLKDIEDLGKPSYKNAVSCCESGVKEIEGMVMNLKMASKANDWRSIAEELRKSGYMVIPALVYKIGLLVEESASQVESFRADYAHLFSELSYQQGTQLSL